MCNRLSISPLPNTDDEDSWRERHLTLLGRAHSLGGFLGLTLELEKPTLGVTLSAGYRDVIR
jgi:hypothetical protein